MFYPMIIIRNNKPGYYGGKMRLSKLLMMTMAVMLLCSACLTAQIDKFGKVDTLYAETYQIDDQNWAVNISLVNDEEILALSLPFKFSAGKNRVVVDSTIFKGGVVENFRVKYARVDTATQCVTIGLINDIGVSIPPIPPGRGRIATIFISSLDEKSISALKVDTTTTPPGNDLQLVKPPTDQVVPAFVVKQGEKPKESIKKN